MVLYKIVYEINSGETKSLTIYDTFKKGDLLKLNDAIVIFDELTNDSLGKRIWVKTGGKNTSKHSWLLEKAPPFLKALPNSKPTGDSKLKKALEQWRNDNTSSISQISNGKSLRDRTTVLVGPTNKYRKILKNAYINDKRLEDVLSVGYMDSECNVKPFTEQSEHYDLILCPDAYSAFELLEDNLSINICSMFFDISTSEYSDDYFQWVQKIEKKNKLIIFCIQENMTFDLNALVDSGYSVFQWKKNYITDEFIFDDKNPDSLLLSTFKERSFKRVVFENDVLKKYFEKLKEYQKEMQDSDPELIKAYYQFFLEIINIAKNICFENNDFLLNRKAALQQKIENLENPYVKNVIGKHPLIPVFSEMIKDLLNFYGTQNKKTYYLITYIIEHPNEHACVVVPDNKWFDTYTIGEYLNGQIHTLGINNSFDILSISSYKDCSNEYDVSFFVGWNSKNIMKEALLSNNAYKNIVLLYSFEVPWMNFAISKWNQESYKNNFSILDPIIETPADESLFIVEEDGDSKFEDIVESFDSLKTNLSDSLANNKKNHINYGNNEFTDAALVNFADDTYGIFSRFKSFVCINEVLKGNENKPTEKNTEDLFLIFRSLRYRRALQQHLSVRTEQVNLP